MDMTISRAGLEDLPALAKINALSYLREPIAQFAYKNWPDEPNMISFFTARLKDRFEHAKTQVFKATTGSGSIAGFVCWTLEEGGEAGPGFKEPMMEAKEARPDSFATPTSKIIDQMPPYFNLDFVMTTGAEIEKLKLLMNGHKHYYLSAFAVEPQYQGQGLGSQLLRHCLQQADSAGLRTWLISFPGSHSLYLRHGFRDVEHKDIDLNQWDQRRLRGYGIYRSYAMVREPIES